MMPTNGKKKMSRIQAIAELASDLVMRTQATHKTLAKKSKTPSRKGSQARKSSQVSKNQTIEASANLLGQRS